MDKLLINHLFQFPTTPYFIFLTGASGSGKTTILKAIGQELPDNLASINYFDDIGIPSFDQMVANYGTPEKWQEAATHAWIEKLVKVKDKKLVFLEGSFYPEFAVSYLQNMGIKSYLLVCTYAEREIREKRLHTYRNQPDLVTQDMENFAQVLKSKTLCLGGKIIDSSMKSPGEAAQEIMNLILKNNKVKPYN